ncbi:hypothetical protein O181_001918 [Austropuccinia psidii MF-1]|uniref:Uncharacterized protein n=1 Tax=Austropuccinia psidii MF-1 TaxID=1389203 RepID=A0A9Q3GC58_9BASI|nr:hypothetical protein [Austropuccinia psidii MF-1]
MDTNIDISDMSPHKKIDSPEASDMDSSSKSIISISKPVRNPPPNFPEGSNFKPPNNKGKNKICLSSHVAPEITNGKSGALSPSSDENNDGPQINTENNHPEEILDIQGVTNSQENILQSQTFGVQAATNLPNKDSSTGAQSTVVDNEIILTQTNNDA